MNAESASIFAGKRVLVSDVDQRVGLYLAQVLGRAGAHVIGSARRARPVSRYVRELLVCTPEELPQRWQEVHAKAVCHLAVPISINACWQVQSARAQGGELPPTLGFPAETLSNLNDKLNVVNACERASVDAPATMPVENTAAAHEALKRFGMPLVLKLRNDIGTYLAPADRYCILRDPDELEAQWQRLSARGPLIAQEFIQGKGCGVGVLLNSASKMQSAVAYRRVREYPLSGGPSSCAETIDDPDLVASAQRLLSELAPGAGVAHVEFRRTPEGRAVVMEINPRFWGTVRLAEHAGVPLALQACEALLRPNGRAVVQLARAGVRARSLPHDLMVLLANLRGGKPGPAMEVVCDLLRPGILPLVHDWRDPLASLHLALNR